LPDTATPTSPDIAARSGVMRFLMLALAVVSLALGALGLFLPLLPTVPFLLLATWAAARSSPRLQQALLNHPRLGPPIKDWQNGGVIPRRAKVMATLAMTASAVMMVFVISNGWVCAVAIGLMAAMLVWIWFRPEQPPRA
jgi:uncharacterized protein